MLRTLLASLLTLGGCLSQNDPSEPISAIAEPPPPEPGPAKASGPEAVPGATLSWTAQVQRAIQAEQYAPAAEGDSFVAGNPAQDFRLSFGAAGVAVAGRRAAGSELQLRLSAWGREGAEEQTEAVIPELGDCRAGGVVDSRGACIRNIHYNRPRLVEWWENREEGLEQGFFVEAAPEGEGPLIFVIEVKGAEVEVEEEVAMLHRSNGAALRYGGLVAWDETGRTLPVWMEEVEGGLRLVVDDSAAVGKITVDPLLTTVGWMVDEADQDYAYFGYSVASAGDVNGDGYGDVIVGARSYETSSYIAEGRVYLYLGSAAGLGNNAAWTSDPTDQANAEFGISVASAGDVNGDGYGDLIVGAIRYDSNSYTDEGRAYLYLGTATGLDSGAAWTADPADQAMAFFGGAVASAGDVNGDGYGDVIVGAFRYDSSSYSDEGRAYLYLGSATGLNYNAAWTVDPADQATAYFGKVAVSAGDVNGDGYGDVIVGAYNYGSASYGGEGRAYLYLGSATGLASSAAWTADPTDQFGAYFGYSVASAGDVNGDGYGDVVVGATGYGTSSYGYEGRAYLYLGSAAGLDSSAAWTTDPTDQFAAYFGGSVASAGDINGDGYGDVIVGAYLYDSGSYGDEGRAFLYLGSAAGLASSAAWIADPVDQASATFGLSVASAGDVNGDGYGDVIIGARSYDSTSYTDEGAAYVYTGSASGLSSSSSWSQEPADQASAWFGISIASAGDVNGDGYNDVIIGAEGAGSYLNEGRAYVYPGTATGLDTVAIWSVDPTDQAGASFGRRVASAGDVNGDGYADVIVGATNYNSATYSDDGRAYLYLGSASGLDTNAAWILDPADQVSAHFGAAVASAGDVNGDGYGDVIVGAHRYDTPGLYVDEGRAWLFLGSANGLATTAAWTADPTDQIDAYFGQSVASAGDVNGDGFGDVIVGAFQYDSSSWTQEGRAYLYFGSATGLSSSAAWTADPVDQIDGFFGWVVASAGDVNGDGYGDLIIGGHGYNSGTYTDEGRAYLYLGSATGPGTTPDWTTDPADQAGAYFAWSAASAGDINGDGYGDVIIGVYDYKPDSYATEGRAWVYHGSSSGLESSATWTADPTDQAYSSFGYSVASAGDVNGDGYGDVIVGAYRYNSTSYADEGAVYLYLGNSADGTGPAVSRRPQARQTGSSTPIAPGLTSADSDRFDVSVQTAGGAWGMAKVALQIEVEPLGSPFDGADLITSSTYTSSGLAGVAIQETVNGLDVGSGYHWRARVLVSPAEGRPQGWGPWMYGGLSGDPVGGHVYTAASSTYVYADTDGDGFGDSTISASSRGNPTGFVADATDCDDNNAAANPGAPEICDPNNTDEDCNGTADDADSGTSAATQNTWYLDSDGDGYGVTSGGTLCDAPGAAYVTTGGDCNDGDGNINPAAPEICDAANLDEDCDGTADDADSSAETSGMITFYADNDGDSYGSSASSLFCELPASGYSATPGDCDDSRAAINPAAPEICDAANTDEDCDGFADDADSSSSANGKTAWYSDRDGDGYGSTSSTLYCDPPGVGFVVDTTDCNDGNAAISPAAQEVCDSFDADEDCDGAADDADASTSGRSDWYADTDADGYGAGAALPACTAPSGYVADTTDCNDNNTNIHPTSTEVPGDEVDQDCDSSELCFVDADADGYRPDDRRLRSENLSCTDPGEATASLPEGDCDDSDAAYNPAAEESNCDDPNDYNCDGSAGGLDADEDGFVACEDCDDADATVNPAATDTPDDGIDQDCTEGDAVGIDDSGFTKTPYTCGCGVGRPLSPWLVPGFGILVARRRSGRGRLRHSGRARPAWS